MYLPYLGKVGGIYEQARQGKCKAPVLVHHRELTLHYNRGLHRSSSTVSERDRTGGVRHRTPCFSVNIRCSRPRLRASVPTASEILVVLAGVTYPQMTCPRSTTRTNVHAASAMSRPRLEELSPFAEGQQQSCGSCIKAMQQCRHLCCIAWKC